MNVFSTLDKMLDPEHPCFTTETASNIIKLEPLVETGAREGEPLYQQAHPTSSASGLGELH